MIAPLSVHQTCALSAPSSSVYLLGTHGTPSQGLVLSSLDNTACHVVWLSLGQTRFFALRCCFFCPDSPRFQNSAEDARRIYLLRGCSTYSLYPCSPVMVPTNSRQNSTYLRQAPESLQEEKKKSVFSHTCPYCRSSHVFSRVLGETCLCTQNTTL